MYQDKMKGMRSGMSIARYESDSDISSEARSDPCGSEDVECEEKDGSYLSGNTSDESAMGDGGIARLMEKAQNAFDTMAPCTELRDPEACRDVVFSTKYDKGFTREEAFQKLVTRAFLIPGHSENRDKMMDVIVPTQKFLMERLQALLGPTRLQKMQHIREAQEKLRDYLGSTISVPVLKKMEKLTQQRAKEEIKKEEVGPLPIEREQNYKLGKIKPRISMKTKRKTTRQLESNEMDPIPEPDMNRLKNSLWRIQTDNYEMAYPVSCEIRRKHRMMITAQKTHLGPGTYYVDEYYDKQQEKKFNMGKGYLKQQAERFSEKVPSFIVPSAIAYGNPYSILDKRDLRESGSTRTIFETSLPFQKPIMDQTPDMCSYPIISSVEKLLESRKGIMYPEKLDQKVKMYRNKDPRGHIKSGYFKTPEKAVPNSAFMPKSFVDLMMDPRRKNMGVFSSIERDAYDGGIHSVRRPRIENAKDFPGPGQYFNDYTKPPIQSTPPTVEEEKICCTMKTKYEEPGNPMYYNEGRGYKYLYKQVIGDGAQSAFKSGTSRLKRERQLFLAERVKGLNIPVQQCSCETGDNELT